MASRGHYRLEQIPGKLHIPAHRAGVLASRIDRLQPAEKALLQTLAVIGEIFPWSLLARVVEQPEDYNEEPAGAAASRGIHLRAAGVSGGGVQLQACADPGGDLRLPAKRAASCAA
ncbi:hypothetical protein ACU4GD_10440 [Cupriavidus basilensis]